MRLILTALMATITLSLLPLTPTLACSPITMFAQDLTHPLVSKRFSRVVHAEVVATSIPRRRSELRTWRHEIQKVAAANAHAAAVAVANDTRAVGQSDGPPQPPPEPPIPTPVVPLTIDEAVDVELLVLETLLGADQETIHVSAGGPCGGMPTLGKQYIFYTEYNGGLHYVQGLTNEQRLGVEPQFLEQVRRCSQEDCTDAP